MLQFRWERLRGDSAAATRNVVDAWQRDPLLLHDCLGLFDERWPFGEHSDYRLVIDAVVITLARKKNEAVFLLLSRRHHLTDLGLACALRGLRRLCDTRRFGRGRFEALYEH